jgi:DNA-binding transcriptional regulator YbjK
MADAETDYTGIAASLLNLAVTVLVMLISLWKHRYAQTLRSQKQASRRDLRAAASDDRVHITCCNQQPMITESLTNESPRAALETIQEVAKVILPSVLN